jgi:hypothetical protein
MFILLIDLYAYTQFILYYPISSILLGEAHMECLSKKINDSDSNLGPTNKLTRSARK